MQVVVEHSLSLSMCVCVYVCVRAIAGGRWQYDDVTYVYDDVTGGGWQYGCAAIECVLLL